MKMAAASVAFTDMEFRPTRHAGRGGVGAVMGAKGVKVIVVDDTGCKARSPKDAEKFKEANVGLSAKRRIQFFNSGIECRLLEYELYEGSRKQKNAGSKNSV